jgi:trk system potassium uptake protein TrkA
MKVVVLGAGDVGFQIAKQLIDENKNVVVIDRDMRVTKHAATYLDCMVINDEGNNIEVLKKAGINKADFFIAVTDSDELNMISCGLVSSEFKVPFKIARVRNLEYSRTHTVGSPFLGIDHIVNPDIEVSKVISRSIEHGALGDILFFEKTKFQMRNITISADSIFVNKTLKEIKSNSQIEFLVAFILRDNSYVIPSGDTVIQEQDNLYLVATKENLEKLFIQTGKLKISINKILIVGGGRIGSYIADYLVQKQQSDLSPLNKLTHSLLQKWKKNVVIIDNDLSKCNVLAERFPDVLIINEDISNEGVYEAGQFYDYDLMVTTTDNQELNIVTAVYAKTLGIKRTIAVVNKNSYINIASNLGIDVTVSQKSSMVNSILKLIRRGNIRNIYSFLDGMVEVMELSVENSKISGIKIKEIKLPAQTLIVSLTRGNQNILPDGNCIIKNGDYIIVIARKESISKIENIFTSKQ